MPKPGRKVWRTLCVVSSNQDASSKVIATLDADIRKCVCRVLILAERSASSEPGSDKLTALVAYDGPIHSKDAFVTEPRAVATGCDHSTERIVTYVVVFM